MLNKMMHQINQNGERGCYDALNDQNGEEGCHNASSNHKASGCLIRPLSGVLTPA